MHRKAGANVGKVRTKETARSVSESPEDDTALPTALTITRRKNIVGHVLTQKKRHAPPRAQARDIASMQEMWLDHARAASQLYTPSMWRVLYAVRNEAKTTQSDVLSACRTMLPKSQRHLWPKCRKSVDDKIKKSLGSFHSRTMRQVQIDLSHHGLPGLEKPVKFAFIDPIYAWACCAHRVSFFDKLHFEFVEHVHPTTGERLYGASVAHGDIMRRACRQVPTEPALIGISYDAGQASKRRSYIPIILSVANTDSRCMEACCCIGYMPFFEWKDHCTPDKLKAVMHELRQACIRAILDVIEGCGQHGFECLLWEDTHKGKKQNKRLLYPIVCRMEFDTKERYKFFCCHKQHACGIGSGPRQGHSALRPCTPHASRHDIAAKRLASSDKNSVNFAEASASLRRRGIDPPRRCTSLMGRKFCLINWPGRIHFGLFAYDVLHVLYNGCVGYLLTALLDTMTTAMKRVLDTRVQKLATFRNDEGVTCKGVNKLSSIGYLSAEMKVLHLFVWSQVLGSQALLLKPEVRADALVAISSLQIICYSVRGKKPYTEAEHRFVFATVGRRFWRALSNIENTKRQAAIAKAEAYNVGKPPHKRRRVPHYRAPEVLSDESTDTASSTDEDVPPFYIRSEKILPHGFEHFPDQVLKGGTHLFHDSSMQEMTHPRNIGKASLRSRTYLDVNESSASMLKYLNESRLLSETCIQAAVAVDVDSDEGESHHIIFPTPLAVDILHLSLTTYLTQHAQKSSTKGHPRVLPSN